MKHIEHEMSDQITHLNSYPLDESPRLTATELTQRFEEAENYLARLQNNLMVRWRERPWLWVEDELIPFDGENPAE